jgi:hypothetical protein
VLAKPRASTKKRQLPKGSLLESLEYRRIVPLEVIAASLAMHLSIDELEWLWRELAKRTEAERGEVVRKGQGEPLVPATLQGRLVTYSVFHSS